MAVRKEAETHELTLVHTNRAGRPADDFLTIVAPLDERGDPELADGPPSFVFGADSTTSLRLPRGRYLVTSQIVETRTGLTQLVQPVLDLGVDRTVALDARQGRPVSVTVPQTRSTEVTEGLDFVTRRTAPDGYSVGMGVLAGQGDRVYSAQLGNAPARGMSMVTSFWAQLDADGHPVANSQMYNLAWVERDRVLTGYRRTVTPAELSTVHVDYAQQVTRSRGSVDFLAWAPPEFGRGTGFGWVFDLPSAYTQFFNADRDVHWERSFSEFRCPVGNCPVFLSALFLPPLVPLAGQATRERWNRAVFGPALPAAGLWASRSDDRITASVPLFSDSADRAGDSVAEGDTLLYANGRLLATSSYPGFGEFTVPRSPAVYRLATRAGRGATFPLSTQVDVTWTFRSGHVPGETPIPLPLSVVRFDPQVDVSSTAPAGRPFPLPVSVQRQAGAPATRLLLVQVSYDDGRHWGSVAVRPTGDGAWEAQLRHPDAAGFVSLRAVAVDRAGNTVEETIMRAYRIR